MLPVITLTGLACSPHTTYLGHFQDNTILKKDILGYLPAAKKKHKTKTLTRNLGRTKIPSKDQWTFTIGEIFPNGGGLLLVVTGIKYINKETG